MLSALLVIVGAYAAARFLDRRSFDDLGFYVDRRFWIDGAFGFVLGALLMAGILGAERLFGWAQYRDAAEVGDVPRIAYVGVSLFSFLSIAIREEVVSRGYHLTNLAEGFHSKWITPTLATTLAVLLSSAFFGLGHAGNPNAGFVSTGNIVLAGVWLALGYVLTGKLAIPIGIHISWNFFQNLFGMPVSGTTEFFLGSIFARDVTGPEWITGGAFGPEAGMTGLVAMTIGTLATLGWVRMRYGTLRVQPSIAEYERRV
jgi:membrane protease YdiL (CAAX protease family)